MTPCRIVEFVGIPGAGKSKIASALHQQAALATTSRLPQREEFRLRKLTGAEKVAIDIRYAPQLLRYRLRRVAYHASLKGARPKALSVGWEKSRYPGLLLDYISKHPAALFVLDEWLVHRTIDEALRMYPDDLTYGSRFGLLPIRGITACHVFVDIEVATALSRITEEHQPGRRFLKKQKDQESIFSVLQAWRCRVEDVRAELSKRGAPIVSIDGTRDVGANVESVSHWLTTLQRAEQ